jgi:hypothetical protein
MDVSFIFLSSNVFFIKKLKGVLRHLLAVHQSTSTDKNKQILVGSWARRQMRR